MNTVTQIFNHTIPEIGFIARKSTIGEEVAMVNTYINYLVKKHSNLKSKHISIFCEPQIDTGYPDIVVVEHWGQPKERKNIDRFNLSTTDLKILYQVEQHKYTSSSDLSSLLGFSIVEIEKSFIKLGNSELIHLSKSKQYARNKRLSDYSNIKRIISIEAKIDKWSEAIQQATRNTWFSTESFVLLNKEKCSETIINKCKEKGLGIILVNGQIKTLLNSEQRTYPVSYASLLFNEWMYKRKFFEENL